MKCREVQAALNRAGLDGITDGATLQHIRNCERCAESARAEELLSTAIESGRNVSASELDSFDTMKRKVVNDFQVMATTRQRPVWVYPVISAAAALVITVAALLPDHGPRVVGYRVAFSGVEPRLVENSETMCDLLMRLGLPDADIEAIGCDSTCNFNIVRLKSESEAKRVVHAVSTIQTEQVTATIYPVHKGEPDLGGPGENVL